MYDAVGDFGMKHALIISEKVEKHEIHHRIKDERVIKQISKDHEGYESNHVTRRKNLNENN